MKINLNFDRAFLLFLVTLVVLPILAPILSHIGLHSISKVIYFIYSFSCHQFHSRSIHIFDNQFAWCARDTGIWIGVLGATLLYKFKFIRKISFIAFVFFIIPIALDGGIQTLYTFFTSNGNTIAEEGVYLSNNLTRFITGSIFGTGVGLFITPQILQSQSDRFKNIIDKLKFEKISVAPKLAIYFVALLILYASFIQIWTLTSTAYKPTNALDSEAKKQGVQYFYRRKNGECPVIVETISDFIYIC